MIGAEEVCAMLPTLEDPDPMRSETWHLPLGDGRVECPARGFIGVERCIACGFFVGYVDGAVLCTRTRRSRPSPTRSTGTRSTAARP